MKHWSNKLPKSACRDALTWAQEQKSAQSAWDTCKRGNWMLWLLGKLSGPPESDLRKKLVLAACGCARLALPYVKKYELRPRIAIEIAEQYARGENGITLEQVKDTAYAATYAADTADTAYAAAYATYAAYAAAYAADAADAADAAYAATDAAYAATYAADTAYAADINAIASIRTKVLSQCADIIREHYPEAPKLC